MSSNTAAFLTGDGAPLEVKPAPYPSPQDDQVVVKSHALALNPVDHAQQTYGPKVFAWLKYPAVLGCDVAGEVVEVGSGVTKFKVGDRVAGCTMGTFQQYVALQEQMVAPLPDAISYEDASVLPLCLSVAVKALFHPDYLALDLPTLQHEPKDKTVLIWGGSTSVGCNVIQLAKAAGYEVITTASPGNFEYVKKLGADQVFDYNAPDVKNQLVSAVKGKTVAGAIANGGMDPSQYEAIVDACAAVVLSSPVSRSNRLVPLTMVPRFTLPQGVETKFVEPLLGDTEHKDLAAHIFNTFVPEALANGLMVSAPRAKVAGHGLDVLQSALDTLRAGASATKIVVTL
ncbi:hypothetical protein N3K66_005271 [Trichothecium roseum]|uniref:Uncharacterized protein n=1 Tax=Trichothecium roseum TaxID=47278 RepID=A0ACC0UY33_9HYPO|nr:hypothetical protein N3K66_005271 [Trichothecium roseum]